MRYLILALALTLPLSVGAFKPEDLEKLKKTNGCPNCDLSRANLKGADLVGTYLAGADLRNADLRGANLQEAKLQGANLVVTYLAGAKLWKANLEGAILCNTTMPDGRIEYSGCILKRIEELLERK